MDIFKKRNVGSVGSRIGVHAANLRHRLRLGRNAGIVKWSAVLRVPPDELERELRNGWDEYGIQGWIGRIIAPGVLTLAPKPNLVVDSGIFNSLDRQFGINGPPSKVQSMGVDDGVSNPVAGTNDSTSGSTNRRIILFDSTPTRTAKVTDAIGTFTEANVAFTIKRLFLSKAAAGTTDSAGDLVAMTDVFTHDNTPFTSWSETYTAQYTGSGS